MFVLIWATLLFTVRRSNADTGSSPGGKNIAKKDSTVSLSGEITAEAGLCVVIPCSFTTGNGFIPQHIVWYKCEPSEPKCRDSDIIFNTTKKNKVQSGFKGQVSLLEPDVTQGNCSIIVNDLTESDSGSYQLRVNGKPGSSDFLHRATVSVKGLTQRPTVMIPPLTEGQQTTLTCTAPGLCSGSVPEITWTWGGAGEMDSHITGNITAFKTENLTAVTQRHSSTLTFNPSAKHHGTDVTCKVSFANSITTLEMKTLNVTSPVQQRGPHSAVLPWAVAGVSLSVNVLCTIFMIFLWKARTNVTPNQEDRTYMSLQKTDRSPEYDVIGQTQDYRRVEAPLPSFSLYECIDASVVQEQDVIGQLQD